MHTSQFEKLRKPSVIVISAGHGDGDPGAVNGIHQEAKQAVLIVDKIASILKDAGVTVDVVPHANGLKAAIKYINSRYDAGDAWAIEIHRDSADGLPSDQASFRCGTYYYPSGGSAEIAQFLKSAMVRAGAHGTSWARPDTDSRHGTLAWVRQTDPVAHLLELGFMEGSNSESHLLKLAAIAAGALYEAFTGLSLGDNTTLAEPVSENEKPVEPQNVEPVVPMITVTPASTVLERLVAEYKSKDLAALFKKLKATVHPEDYDDLQNATLAQWILESGWGKSELAQQHFNFGGLKWRDEMSEWTVEKDGVVVKPVEYKAWDGKGTYCKFESPSAFISGYWRFIMRSPYKGWIDHASNPSEYISYLLKCGYTQSDTYLNEVMSLVPKAIALLAGATAHPQSGPPVAAVVPKVIAFPEGTPGPGAVNVPASASVSGSIGDDHWLKGVKKAPIGSGNPLTPLCVVIHYTEGFGADGSISGWKKKNNGILAHVVVDRDGTVFQCRPFNQTCGHAGTSRWQDPLTGKFYNGVNSVSIGIEIANTGMVTEYHKKLGSGGPYPDGSTIDATHRNGKYGSSEAKGGKKWEVYPKEQLKAVFNLVALLMKKYDLHDITGHDCIAVERKADPGPAFPMLELRKANGLSGLPVVLSTKGEPLPV